MRTTSQFWNDAVQLATKVVNANTRKYLLSNDEKDDLIQEATIEAFTSLETRGVSPKIAAERLRHRLPRWVNELRQGGLIVSHEERDGEQPAEDLEFCPIHLPAPKPREPGDATFFSEGSTWEDAAAKEEAVPLLQDALPAPDTSEQTDAEISVARMLADLPADEARLIADYYGLGGTREMTAPELAARDGLTVAAVEKRLQRIEKKLRELSGSVLAGGAINREEQELIMGTGKLCGKCGTWRPRGPRCECGSAETDGQLTAALVDPINGDRKGTGVPWWSATEREQLGLPPVPANDDEFDVEDYG